MVPVFQFAELLDVVGFVVGTVGVDDGAFDEEDGIFEVVVGTGGNESVGFDDATLQNCCARLSEAVRSFGQLARMHAASSDVKRGLSWVVRSNKINRKKNLT
jgi:hypothetical protein